MKNDNITDFKSIKIRLRFINSTDIEVAVPLKYLHNF